MKTDQAKQLLRARSSLCELANAHLKHHHGMAQVLVRGLHKVTCVAVLAAIDSEGGSAGVPPARRPIGANILQHATALLA